MARHDQIIRLLNVANALAASRRGVALKSLAERHGWRLRSVYRDRDALEAAGFTVIDCGEGRFRIENQNPLIANAPTADERLALFLAREQARAWRHTSLGKALDRLWNRLSSGNGQAALVPVESAPWITTRDWTPIDYGRHRVVVASLERAVRDRVAVQTHYKAASTRQVTSRVIEPGQLHWDPGLESLYLIGWCRLRGDVRVFAAHRFLAVRVLEERCAPRAETRSAAALKDAFRVWRGGNVEKVRIWFAAEVAEEIRERRWLPAQKVEAAEDGGVVLTGKVAGLTEIERWVLGYGGRARVLSPRGLATALATAHRDALRESKAAPRLSLSRDDNDLA